jgi:pre-mRNA-processing factor SLU7
MPPPPKRPPPGRPSQAAATTSGSTHTDGSAGAARKEDNIYIPSYISKQPFYVSGLDDADDALQHQRRTAAADGGGLVNDRSLLTVERSAKTVGPARTKWVKGACENCGAMGHTQKTCLERPRKKGAKFTGKDIQADRAVREVQLGYEAKRDIWAAYDPKQYREVVEEYELLEEARRKLQQQKGGSGDSGEEGKNYEEGFKYAEESELGKDKSIKQSMRIREDTAKYLLNLDADSAKYNPKKRALVDPGAIGDKSAQLFAEESFLRASGEAAEFERAQRLAWEAQERTGDTSLHLQANPTAGALKRKKAELLASQYGVQPEVPETVKAVAAVTESETFVEYDEAGLIKGAPKKEAKSKYAEDVFINNHTSVWGSWWSDFKWGYACCHSFVKNSYCTGETGKRMLEQANSWDKLEGGEDGENVQENSS